MFVVIFFAFLFSYVGWGSTLSRVLNTSKTTASTFDILNYVIAGSAVIVIFGTLLNFFTPLTQNYTLILHACGVSLFIFNCITHQFESRSLLRQTTILIALTLVLLPLFASADPTYDQGLYYLQTIKWMQNEPLVMGLGKLHSRLAHQSTFHILAAMQNITNFRIFSVQILDLIWGLPLLTKLIYNCFELKDNVPKRIFSGILFLLLFYHPHNTFVPNLGSSIAPDFAVMVLVCTLLLELFDWQMKNQTEKLSSLTISILVAYFAVTVKVSALPLIGIGFWFTVLYLLQYKQSTMKVLALHIPGLVLLACTSARHFFTSACFLYPVKFSCFDRFSWSITKKAARDEVAATGAWAKHMGFDEDTSIGNLSWIRDFWLEYMSRDANLILSVLLILGFILLALVVWKQRKSLSLSKLTQPIPFIMLIFSGSLCAWFLAAPDVRFAAGIMTGFLALSFYSFWKLYGVPFQRQLVSALSISILLVLAIYSGLGLQRYYKFSYKKTWFASKTPSLVSFQSSPDFSFKVPFKSDQCFFEEETCGAKIQKNLKLTRREGRLIFYHSKQ